MAAWILGGILLLAVLGAVWIGVRGFLAYQHLDSARASAANAAETLSDPASAASLIDDIAADTSAAHDLTSDVVWKLAEGLPWIGPQLSAVSTVAASLDDVASTALTPLASVAASFSIDSIRPQDGTIDLAPFAGLREAADAGAAGLGAVDAAISRIDTAPLLGPVRDAVDEVAALLDETFAAADALRRTTALLPAMLGSDGPRDYLIVFQNNAEWRSLGGIVGAMVLLHTDGGRITLSTQASSSDFPHYDAPVVPLTDDEIRLFGTQPATFVQNVTQIPDFTRDAPIIQQMWERETGTVIDGVIALDPVALSYLLETTGPLTLPTGDELTAENAVPLLLNEVYLRYERPADQDAFFAAAAATVFTALSSGDADPAALVEALSRAGTENRLLLWNAVPEEQAILDGTTLQGVLGSADPSVTDFGVFVNDGTSSKMDYYMELAADAAWCASDEAALTVTLRNAAPLDAASLPQYVTGGGKHGIPPGEVETVTYVYLPADAAVVTTSASENADFPGFGGGTDAGRQVLTWTTRLSPGEEASLDLRVRTPSTERIVTRTTPTINVSSDSQLAPSCGSPE
ncbi:hypothetical protein GCM10027408_25380 [Microbacterium tumbae]